MGEDEEGNEMSGFTEIALLQYELAKLHTRVAELEERRCEVCGYAEHHREHTGCLRKQVSSLKAELREICAAIDDPACDLTLTTVECIKKLKAENEWQPIETAPKDGSFILLATPKGRIADGFWSLVYGVWSWPYVKVEPTHWMPLPTPPERSMHGRLRETNPEELL